MQTAYARMCKRHRPHKVRPGRGTARKVRVAPIVSSVRYWAQELRVNGCVLQCLVLYAIRFLALALLFCRGFI